MLNLDLKLQQKLNIFTGLIQSLEVLSMNSYELEEFLKEESQENVMLDFKSRLEDERYLSHLKASGGIKSSNNFVEDLVKSKDLTEHLTEQLRELELERDIEKIIHYLILNLNESGYLTMSLEEVSKKLAQNIEKVKTAHSTLLKFEPKGVGARNLVECLLSQTREEDTLLKKIIENYLEEIAKNKLSMMAEELGVSTEEVKQLVNRIRKLNPKPGQSYQASKKVEYVFADVFLEIENREIHLQMDLVNNIYLNQAYLSMLSKDIDEQTREYLNSKLNRTLLIKKAVEKRNTTLNEIVKFIVEYQKDYFIYNSPLRPLRQKDVAEEIGISISTVSRAVSGKCLEYNKGVVALNDLFVGSTAGNEVSRDYIKKRIKEIISQEDKSKPLSDNKIVSILEREEINIKRRTVQKYRDELKIASSQMRREYGKKT